MTYASKRFYQNELALQKILLIGTCLLYLTFYFGLMMQFVLGVVQVTSGLVHAIYFRDPKRQKYLVGVAAYFATWFIYGAIPALHNIWVEGFMMIVWGVIVPMSIATWYYYLLKKDVEAFEKEEENYAAVAWQEEILDA